MVIGGQELLRQPMKHMVDCWAISMETLINLKQPKTLDFRYDALKINKTAGALKEPIINKRRTAIVIRLLSFVILFNKTRNKRIYYYIFTSTFGWYLFELLAFSLLFFDFSNWNLKIACTHLNNEDFNAKVVIDW